MTEVSIRRLISIYNELDNAIFFDGIGEFLRNENYTDDEWKKQAERFLNNYQKLLEANPTIAKYDYLLRTKESEAQLAYFGDSISRTTSKQQKMLQDDFTNNRPDEPFDGYFELICKMSIPFDALKQAQKEIGDYSMPITPIVNESIKEFGVFTFIVNDGRVKSVQYRGKTLKLQPKYAGTFLCIMCRCYDNASVISMDEIREFHQKPADSEASIRTQASRINNAVRNAANLSEDDKLIVNANEIAPCMFKLDTKLLARI